MESEIDYSFSVEAVVRGYHVYHEVWPAPVGEQLTCRREIGNSHDPFAVSVITTASTIVGHVPRRISSVCSVFLRRGELIFCRVIGTRQYSGDLPQGGMEVPCILTFQGESKEVAKAEKLLKLTSEKNLQLKSMSSANKEDAKEVKADEKMSVMLLRCVIMNSH